jgi:hypothetical protein
MKKIKKYEEFTNEEINWRKGLATAALGASLMGGIQSCDSNKEEETKKEQIVDFNRELDSIQNITPEDLIVQFNKSIESSPSLSVYSESPDLYNSQIATFYDSKSKELVNFIIDILIYKGVLKDRNVSIHELEEFIERIKTGSGDEFDNLILETFNKVIEYQKKFIEYDRKSGSLRKTNF